MTPPPEQATPADPITTILVSITEMRGELRAALADLQRHSTDITTLFSQHNSLRDRVVALETRDQADDRNRASSRNYAAIVWSAIAAIASVAAIVLAVLLAIANRGA